jgi:hypothetical protein
MAAGPDGLLLHQDRDGTSVLIDWVSPNWPLSSAFPSFIVGPLLGAIARTVAWLGVGTLVAWMLRLLRPRTFGAAALAATTLGVAGVVATASLLNHAGTMPATVALEARARVPLLDRFDRVRRPTTVLYNPLSRITAADALARVTLVARPGLRPDPEPLDPLWNARFALPAGDYLLQFTRTGMAVPPDVTLALQVGRSGPPMERWNVTGPRWEHRFVLPVDADYVGILAPPELSAPTGALAGELRLTPVTVVDEGSRVTRDPSTGTLRTVTLRGGEVTALFHGNNIFPETDGYWTRGGSTAEVTYALGTGSPATAIDVVTHCGPVRNELTLSTPGWSERLRLEPGASRTIAIPTMAQAELGLRIAPVSIAVRSGFVPATVERTSTDRRFLGCWIELARQRQP